eukprot:scaffold647929_cov33-Prasinocladus_malaysianus.AAC.1
MSPGRARQLVGVQHPSLPGGASLALTISMSRVSGCPLAKGTLTELFEQHVVRNLTTASTRLTS